MCHRRNWLCIDQRSNGSTCTYCIQCFGEAKLLFIPDRFIVCRVCHGTMKLHAPIRILGGLRLEEEATTNIRSTTLTPSCNHPPTKSRWGFAALCKLIVAERRASVERSYAWPPNGCTKNCVCKVHSRLQRIESDMVVARCDRVTMLKTMAATSMFQWRKGASQRKFDYLIEVQ